MIDPHPDPADHRDLTAAGRGLNVLGALWMTLCGLFGLLLVGVTTSIWVDYLSRPDALERLRRRDDFWFLTSASVLSVAVSFMAFYSVYVRFARPGEGAAKRDAERPTGSR